MPHFAYRAYADKGQVEAGTIEAIDAADASRQLHRAGKRVFDINSTSARAGGKAAGRTAKAQAAMGLRELARLFEEIAGLQEAGFSPFASLRIVATAYGQSRNASLLLVASDAISAGRSFADAVGSLPGMPREVRAMLAGGESSGRLPLVVARLAETFKRRAALRTAALEAIAYPVFLLAVGLATILFLALYLMPTLEPVFANHAAGVPTAVAFFTGLGGILRSAWPVLLGGAALIVLLAVYALRSEAFRAWLSDIATRLPFFGRSIRSAAVSRYLHTLALLTGNGVAMTGALKLAEDTTSAASLRRAFGAIREGVVRGERLHATCKQTGLFDTPTVTLIELGEQSNALPDVLRRAAELLDSKRIRAQARFLAILTPALTIFMGVLIGGLILSVMSSLLSINDAALG